MDVVFVRDLQQLSARVRALGCTRVLVVSAPSRRFVADVTSALVAFQPTVFDGARVHVPAEVVAAARAMLAECGADTIVAVGGGSAIGLGKALRLEADVKFIALPTTYAGSEMTSMYGITTGATKRTGRDPRVRPDLVVYDVMFTLDLPLALSVQSLANSLAHVVSVLSTDSLSPEQRPAAFDAAFEVVRALDEQVREPAALDAREHAQRAASASAAIYEHGKAGVQHALAHLLGGATRLDHAALHAIILPRFITHLRTTRPELIAELETAAQHRPLDAYLLATLERAGAPTTLAQLGADPALVRAALATRPDLPALEL